MWKNVKTSNSPAILAGGAPQGYCTGINLLLVWICGSAGLRMSNSAASLDVDMVKTKPPYCNCLTGGNPTLPKPRPPSIK